MPVMIGCRGCGVPVAEGANVCFVCNCPAPTCHVSHFSPADVATPNKVAPSTEPSQLLNSRWPWLAAAGMASLACAGVAGARLALGHW